MGPYRLLTKLGEGGMGIVHLAQGSDGQRVALKVLRPQVVGDEEARQRLAREVASLTRVRSPWVAEMVDADPWADVPYVVTRYVPGLSLHEHVAAEGPVTGRDLLWLAGCLAEGIAAVHAAGVLHRDVKPGNVLMEGRTPILIDFGLARVADDIRLTQTGWLLGTPGYLAPEILYGDEATPAADVHAWAATVAYAASGRPPYGRGPAMAVMDRTRRGQHDLDGIESPLADVLAAALAPEPLERPLLAEVLAWLRPQSTRPDLPPAPPPGAPFADPSPEVDELTLPLALAAQAPVTAAPVTPPTAPEPATPPTQVLPTAMEPPAAPPHPAAWISSEATQPPPPPIPFPAGAGLDPAWYDAEPAPPPPSLGERARRWVTLGLGAVALGAAVAAAPWVALLCVVLLVWLLRAGSLASSAVAARRTVRGARWYDGLRWVTSSPWHLLRAVTGTVVLVLWSGGLALAVGLLGYALALDVPSTLLACGATLGLALWSGPGSSRLRSPVLRVVAPACRSAGPWLITCAALLVLAGACGALVAARGVAWLPWENGPFGL